MPVSVHVHKHRAGRGGAQCLRGGRNGNTGQHWADAQTCRVQSTSTELCGEILDTILTLLPWGRTMYKQVPNITGGDTKMTNIQPPIFRERLTARGAMLGAE